MKNKSTKFPWDAKGIAKKRSKGKKKRVLQKPRPKKAY